MKKIMPGAEPFFLLGTNDSVVLLLHGFTGSPASVLLVGKKLHSAGYSVYAPLLAGHGTEVEDLQRTTADDWYGDARDAYIELAKNYNQVAVLGVSMGGLLALKLGAEENPRAVVTVATPMYLYDWRVPWAWLAGYFLPYVSKKNHFYAAGEEYHVAYRDRIPVKPVASMWSLLKECRNRHVKRLACSLLVLQSKGDQTVKPESAEYIFSKSASLDKELAWFYKSGHLMILDVEREAAMQRILNFLKERM